MLVRHIQINGGKIYGNKRVHGRKELRDIFLGAAESAMRTETSLRNHYDAARGTIDVEFALDVSKSISMPLKEYLNELSLFMWNSVRAESRLRQCVLFF